MWKQVTTDIRGVNCEEPEAAPWASGIANRNRVMHALGIYQACAELGIVTLVHMTVEGLGGP